MIGIGNFAKQDLFFMLRASKVHDYYVQYVKVYVNFCDTRITREHS